jgi:uroporphyrinogen-III synthase
MGESTKEDAGVGEAKSGMEVLSLRPENSEEEPYAELVKRGVAVRHVPTIAVEFEVCRPLLKAALADPQPFDWIVCTSVNGVRALHTVLLESPELEKTMSESSFAAIGSRTAAEISALFGRTAIYPPCFEAIEIPACLGDVRGQRVLLPRADRADDRLPSMLRARGALAREVHAYQVKLREARSVGAELQALSPAPTHVLFSSPSIVESFARALEFAGDIRWPQSAQLIAIGPVTARALVRLMGRCDGTAPEYTMNGVVQYLLLNADAALSSSADSSEVRALE